MKFIITAFIMTLSFSVFADTYEANFDKQIEQIAIKANEVGKKLQVETMGIEELEVMRQRVEG